ncbi:MAG: ATP-binding protein [Rubricoccaceae bacterium]|nr:ATP-binding protein [Rubricoccaceae bacterium]
MPTPQHIRAEVEEAVHTLLRDWLDPSPEATERFLGRVAAEFTGHGTGPGDYYADREALRAMVRREHEGMSFPFTLDVPWMTVRLPHPTVALAEGVIRVEIDTGEETLVEAPRFSFVLERPPGEAGGRWLLVHFHFSVPDALQDEGGTMDDLLWSRNRELERLVAERTAELEAAQAQLVQQEKMASLGQLTAGIAHEIKNPLNFVNNFAALSRDLADELAAEADPEERQAILADLKTNAAKIEEHGRRADAIVRQMMAHARSGGGEREAVEVNALVEEYVGLAYHGMRARHPGSNVTLVKDLADDAGEVRLVVQEIGRVLINLLDNAFDATRERAAAEGSAYAPTVRVSTRRRADGVEVRIEDNGTGMPAAVRERVFEPFFTTKPTGDGTGLGLSMSYDIVVHGHRGTLTVESAEGEGTAFRMTLPER